MRAKLSITGFGGPTEVTCGGNALKFYASMRLNVRRIGFVKKGEEVLYMFIYAKFEGILYDYVLPSHGTFPIKLGAYIICL